MHIGQGFHLPCLDTSGIFGIGRKIIMTITVSTPCLAVPVWADAKVWDKYDLRISDHKNGEILYTFKLPQAKNAGAEPDYFAYLPLVIPEKLSLGDKIDISCDAPYPVLEKIFQTEEREFEPCDCLHYHAPYGSLNDPNGLLFADGVWHMYHQHNPMDNIWGNMSWGHAVSRDLIHFTFMGDVLFPDKDGVMFSGCGLVNERGCLGLKKDDLLFFYTLAREHKGEKGEKICTFVQRLACSSDGGRTLVKFPDFELPTLAAENRDPKIFFHFESNAYIMVLYLTECRFCILRSEDLKHWEKTDEFSCPPMWECPDLLRFTDDKWAFMSADGYYFIGTFDGYRFRIESEMRSLYGNAIPYAAQSFSGVKDRVISVAWLRTENKGQCWHGMMSVPRELSLDKDAKGYYIRQRFVREADQYIRERSGSWVIEDPYIRETLDASGRELLVEQLF